MTIFLKVKNNAISSLASGISDSATELALVAGEGDKFPSTYPFHITIDDEILRCTDRVDDVLTVTRAQEGTTAAVHNVGALVSLDITAEIVTNLQDGKARTATKVVAASDSSANSKLGADYVCDGTDDQVEIQAAIEALPANGGKIVLLEGTFTFGTKIADITKGNVTIVGQGEATLLDFSGASINYPIKVVGEITATNSLLTVDAAAGDLTITVADGGLFAADDWVRIRSETLFNSGTQHYGEIRQIASVSGNDLTLKEALSFAYTKADTGTVDLLTIVENIRLLNFKIISNNANNNYGIWFQQAANIGVENLTIEDFADRAIEIRDAVDAKVTGCTIRRSNRASLGYGVVIGNSSRDIIVSGNTFADCRHAVTCGGDDTYGIQTNQIWSNNTINYSSRAGGAFGPHNTYDGLVIASNTVVGDGLGYIDGLNTVVCGNYTYNNRCANGAILISVNGKYMTINDNQVVCDGQHGIYCSTTCSASQVLINGNSIRVLSGGYGAIYLRYANFDYLSINDNYLYSAAYSALRISNLSRNAASHYFDIKGNEIVSDSGGGINVMLDADFDLEHLTIEGNTIKPASNTGITISGTTTHKVKYVDIRGNKIISPTAGVYCEGAIDQLQITDNEVYDASSRGIHIRKINQDTTNYAIKDNSLISCATAIDDEMGTGVVYRQHSDLFMDVLAASLTHIYPLTAADTVEHSIAEADSPDVPRNVSVSVKNTTAGALDISETTCTVTGVDAKGNSITEDITVPATTGVASGATVDAYGSKAFAKVTKIKFSAAQADTEHSVGISKKLGLSNIIYATADVYKIKKNNANVAVATAEVNATYDTYDMAVIGLAAGDDFTIWYRSNLNVIS